MKYAISKPNMIQIAFENSHFIAVDKPSEWLSVPSRMGAKDSRNTLGTILQKQLSKQIYPVHRLDFEVSGLMLFALSSEAHKDSQKWFEDKSLQKIYYALTENPQNQQLHPQQEFLWESKILRGKKRAYEHELGKQALTRALVMDSNNPLKWQLEPLTGRSHQLRFELYKRGFPILGDTLYSSQKIFSPGIALRAVKLVFPIEIQKKWSLPEKIEVASLI